jgi:ubiquinol-cytochrome c reductase cytochrome b subunit
VGTVVLLLAIVFGPPPLGAKADPTVVLAYPRPDWYFLWYFALLALIPPQIEDAFIILFPLLLGVMFIILPFVAPTGERSPRRRPWAIGVVVFFAATVATLLGAGYRAPWSPDLEASELPPSAKVGLSGGAALGAQLFETRGCLNCHTIAGAGGARGPNLTNVGARLGPNELTWRILNGGRNMPAYGTTLSPAELSALVEYLGGLR